MASVRLNTNTRMECADRSAQIGGARRRLHAHVAKHDRAHLPRARTAAMN